MDMVKRISFYLCICLLIFIDANAQKDPNKTWIDLDVFTVIDPILKSDLDEIIITEIAKEYYSPNKSFAISFRSDDIMQIEVCDAPFYSESLYGVIIHNTITFIIYGGPFNNKIMQRTGQKQRVEFYKDSSYIDESGNFIFIVSRGSVFSKWVYYYNSNNGQLELIEVTNPTIPPDGY